VPLTPPLSSDRFVITREIGRGGMGVVYEARDEELGRSVALKMLRRFNAEHLYMFKNEFRALAELVHPNLVRLGELHFEDQQWFFTMELLEANSLLGFVRRSQAAPDAGTVDDDAATLVSFDPKIIHRGLETETSDVPVDIGTAPSAPVIARIPSKRPAAGSLYDEARLRACLRQLANGLAALHAAQSIHLDIKPSNVLVEADGRVVVVDFGLVQHYSADPQAPADMPTRRRVAGTVAYMAPEQGLGDAVGPPADWYAVGVLLYEALTGQRPFVGNVVQVLAAKLAANIVPPRELVAGVPEDLEELCLALLRPVPEDRPTGAQVLERLGADPGDGAAPLQAPRALFVGRGDELAQLRRTWTRVHSEGRTVATLVEGQPGVGKSALARAFLRELRGQHPDLILCAGRCYHKESLPFKAFDRIVDGITDVLADLDTATAAALLPAETPFVAELFPVLTRIEAVATTFSPDRRVDDPWRLRALAFAGFRKLIRALAGRGKVALFIDDLQWADAESLALLEDLLDAPDPSACLVMATVRSDPAEAHEDIVEVMARLRQRLETVAVAGLDRDDAALLVEQLWASGLRPEQPVAQALIDEADGHPLFLEQLVRAAAEPGAGSSLEDAIWRRVEAQPEMGRTLLHVLAVAGIPLSHDVLAATADVPLSDCWASLEGLSGQGLVTLDRTSDGRWLAAAYHDRVREAVMGRLADDPRSATVNLRIGRELLRRLAPGDDEGLLAAVTPMNAALHLIEAPRERLRLCRHNVRAAFRAMRSTAYSTATRLLEAASVLLPEDAWERRRELALTVEREWVLCDYLSGRQALARKRFDALLKRLDRVEQAELHVRWVGLATSRGRFDEALRAARRGLELVGVALPDPATPASIGAEYASIATLLGGRSARALVDAPEMRDPAKRAAAALLSTMASPAYFVDATLMSVALMRLTAMSIEHGLCAPSASGFAGYGIVLGSGIGDYHGAYAFGEAALAILPRFDDQRFASRAKMITGTYLAPWVRPFSEAQQLLRDAIETGLSTSDPRFAAYAAATLSLMTWLEGGPLERLEAQAERSIELTRMRQDRDMSGIVECQQRFYATLRDPETRDGLGVFEGDDGGRAFAAGFDASMPIANFYLRFLGAQLLYRAGRLADAVARLDTCVPHLPRVFGIPTKVEYALYQVLVRADALMQQGPEAPREERHTQLVEIRTHLDQLKRWAALNPVNFVSHHALAQAQVARLLGQHDRAVDHLYEARGAARAAGAENRATLADQLRKAWRKG